MKALGWMAVVPLICAAAAQDIPLRVENLKVDGRDVEFRLVNAADKPVTAWRLVVTIETDGVPRSQPLSQDFAISAGATDSESGAQGHTAGALMPGDYHLHSMTLVKPVEKIDVRPTAVIFDDLSNQGPGRQIRDFIVHRQRLRDEYLRWLKTLAGMKDKPDAEMLEALKELASELHEDTKDLSPAERASPENSAKISILSTLRDAVQQLTREDGTGANSAWYVVGQSLNVAYEALRKHTPE